MASETSVNSARNGRSDADMIGGVSSFGHNLLSLAGLQAKLFSLDARATIASSTPALIALGAAGAALFTSLVVGLGGLSWWLAVQLALPVWGSLMLVGIVTAIV